MKGSMKKSNVHYTNAWWKSNTYCIPINNLLYC